MTNTDVERLEAAIRIGARRVEFSDQTVEYPNIEAMQRALSRIRKGARDSMLFRPAVSKGLD